MGKNDGLFDIYQCFGVDKTLPFDEARKKIEDRLEKFREMVDRKPTKESISVLQKAETAYDSLCKNKDSYLDDKVYDFAFNESSTDKHRWDEMLATFEPDTTKPKSSYKLYFENESKKRQARGLIIKKTAIKFVAGVLVCVCAFGAGKAGIKHLEKTDQENNVCVEYQVREGDTEDYLSGLFKEYGISYLEVSGSYRNADYVYEGDVIIGRTTKEKADKMVKEGHARIISIDEACELLGETHALIGEFRAYANGNSDMVFFVPEGKTMV